VNDPFGNATRYEYNQRGQVTKVTHPDGTYTQSAYNNDGTLAWTADENHPNAWMDGHDTERTRYDYDAYKRVTAVRKPGETLPMTNYYGLDWANPLLHTTNCVKYTLSPMNKSVVYEYDENLRKTYQGVALGSNDAAESRFQYDEVGNLTWARDPRWNVTTFGYDARNRKTSMSDPIPSDRNSNGHTVDWVYDGVGNKRYETRADNATREWRYDSVNRLTDTFGFGGERTQYARQLPNDLIEWITDAKGAVYTFTYDALHRKTTETYPPDATGNGRTEHFWYDAAGNLIAYKNPADDYKRFSYDNRNRERDSWWDWGGPSIHKDFDAASRLTRITTNGNETIVAFGYDAANRKIWEEQTLSGYPTRRVETPVDADGNRSGLWVYTNGQANFGVYYDYTQRNQLAHIYDGGWTPWFNYTYDAAGNMTKRQDVYWGVNDSENIPSQSYDALNRPVEWENTGGGDSPFARSWYQYDKVGREVATWRDEQSGKGDFFNYTVRNQLNTAVYDADQVWTGNPGNWLNRRDYGYTADGLNRARVNLNGPVDGYQANALNQYTSVGGQGLGYDNNFNLADYSGFHGDYDAQNRLMSASKDGTTVYFTYDGLGRCVRRVVGGVTTRFMKA
jgi:YD repeat-containing protein